MIGTITPVVHRRSKKLNWVIAVAAYAAAATAAAGVLGAFLGWLGRLMHVYQFSMPTVVVPIVLGLALHELAIIRLPLPQRKWQVPASWRVRFHPWLSPILYGAILGAGVFTYIFSASFYVVLIAAALVGDPEKSAMVMLPFSICQSVALFVAGWHVQSWEDAYAIGTRSLRWRAVVHAINGSMLSAAATLIGMTMSL